MRKDFNRDDNDHFICDTCGHTFAWDDDCAEFDPNFLDLEVQCKRCRENNPPSDDDAEKWKKQD